MARRKVWLFLLPCLVEHHAHGEAGPLLALPQRAQVVGDPLRQHRHDAVGEVDRVAAHLRLAVEARAGPHVVGDVGDGDVHDPAAGVARVGVGCRMHGIVVIARIDGIDGEEVQRRAGRCGPASLGGSRLSTSASTSAGNSSGMPCACTAIRLILRWSPWIAERLAPRAPAARRSGPSGQDRSGRGRRPWRRPRRPARSATPSAPCGRPDR